jgi:hypothetical protein
MSYNNSQIRPYVLNAVKTLLSFFPKTTASKPEAYTAAMVQIFSSYPDSIIAEAINPATGLPCMSEFAPSLKAAKDFLELRARERWKLDAHAQRVLEQSMERPPSDPAMKKRVDALFADLVEHLKSGSTTNPAFMPATSVMKRPRVFIPTTDYRYPRFADWANTANTKLWQFGKSSDDRDGIWVDYRIWTSHESFTKPKAEPFPKEPKVRTADEIPHLTDAAKATLREASQTKT